MRDLPSEADGTISRQEVITLLAEQRAEFERRLAQLTGAVTSSSSDGARLVDQLGPGGQPSEHEIDAPHSRRWLLASGMGAAAAGLAALTTEASPAAATDGQPLVVGVNGVNANAATETTELSGSTGTADVLSVHNNNTGSAIRGRAGLSSGVNIAVRGGVEGDSQEGHGVIGISRDNAGVLGHSVNGIGVIASAINYMDVYAGSSGRIGQLIRAAVGPPTLNTDERDFLTGEQVRDINGQLWICISGGKPGTWQKVAAAAPGANGGSLNMLDSPFRLFDSRDSSGAIDGTGKLTSTTPKTLQVTGTAPDGGTPAQGVPSKAIGVVGSIAVTQPEAAGHARVYPGPTVPNTSVINWVAGQTVAASFTSGLSNIGRMTVSVFSTTHVIIDIVGYVY